MLRDLRSPTHVWLGGQPGGCLRLVGLALLVLLFGLGGGAVMGTLDMVSLRMFLRSLQPGMLFSVLLRQVTFYVTLAGLLLGVYVASRYLQDVFAIPTFWQALRYLFVLIVRLFHPRLNVDDGEIRPQGGFHLLRDVGGPGFLSVQQGNAVVLEDAMGRPRPCDPGSYYVAPFERVLQAISLEVQMVDLQPLRAITLDGIAVEVRDAHFAVRIRSGRADSEAAQQEAQTAHPTVGSALLHSYYNRTVGSGGVTPWERATALAVDNAITGFIQSHRFDDLIAGGERTEGGGQRTAFSREEITRRLNTPATRARLRQVGAELVWVDIGEFHVLDERVDAQLVENYGVPWEGVANVNLAREGAERWATIEASRAQAQAELLQDILEIFNSAGIKEATPEEMEALLFSRVTQFLEAQASAGLLSSGRRGRDEELPPPV